MTGIPSFRRRAPAKGVGSLIGRFQSQERWVASASAISFRRLQVWFHCCPRTSRAIVSGIGRRLLRFFQHLLNFETRSLTEKLRIWYSTSATMTLAPNKWRLIKRPRCACLSANGLIRPLTFKKGTFARIDGLTRFNSGLVSLSDSKHYEIQVQARAEI